MAVARVVVADVGSQELESIRRTLNTVLFMMETAGASITATATAEEVLSAWSAGISAGIDSNPAATANIVSTNRPINLVAVSVAIPQQPKFATKVVNPSDASV